MLMVIGSRVFINFWDMVTTCWLNTEGMLLASILSLLLGLNVFGLKLIVLILCFC